MRFATLLPVAALAAVAAAAPNAVEARNDNNCSTGDNYCCNQKFKNPTTFDGSLGNTLSGLLDLILNVGAGVGLQCDPITGIGVGSGAVCSVQQACCSNVQVNGAVNVACSPIGVNL